MASLGISRPVAGFALRRLALPALLLLSIPCAFGRDTPYFTQIPGAIPDQTPVYAEFVKQITAYSAIVDISHDGLDDIVFHMWKNAVGTNPASAIACTNRLVILIQQPNHTFLDQTSTWLHGAPDLGACSDANRVDDVNGDGYPDIVFATSQEDGRDTNDWSKMFSPVFMLVSGPDGKYTREQIGTPGWYHMVGTGRDASNKPFVAIAAFVGEGSPTNISQFHQRSADGTWVNVSASYPVINPGSFSFFNAAGQPSPSDTLITQAIQGSSNPLDIGGATRDANGVWHTVPNLNLFSMVGKINFITWAGFHVVYDVFRFGDLDVTGGGWLESCQFRMSPASPQMTIMKLSETAIPGGYTGPDQVVSEGDLIKLTHLYGFRIVNGALQQASLPISGEVSAAMEARFFDCKDLNGDGYDDIAVYPLAAYPKGGDGLPYVYLNDKNGGLHYIGQSQFPAQPDDIPNQPDWWNENGRSSLLHDFDHDGIQDLLTWPVAGVQLGGGRDLSYLFYKGTVQLQAPTSPPSLSISRAAVTEGNAGTTLASFNVVLSNAVGAVGFDLATDSGTAYPGSDFVPKSVVGQVIPSGQTSATFTVAINGDTEVEPNETFTLNLTNVTGAVVPDSQALETIVNDDRASLSIADATVVEGNSGRTTARFEVTLSNAMPTPVSFDVFTNGGTAVSGIDFVGQAQPGHIMDAGRTRQVFEVPIIGDATPEADETFLVTVGFASGADVADGSAIGTIVNDDGPAATTTTTSASASASGSGSGSAATAAIASSVPAAPVPMPIHQIQGGGARSRWQGRVVSTSGIVTALTTGGFFLQAPDAQGDDDTATSEGIFIASADGAVRVGDLLRADGRVQEIPAGARADQPTLTQIAATRITVLGRGQALPRVMPLEPAGFERMEAMRVSLHGLRVVGPAEGFLDTWAQASLSTGRFYVASSAQRAGPMLVDSAGQNGAAALSADVGDGIRGLVGVLGQGGDGYKLLPDPAPVARVLSAAAPRRVPKATSGVATIGSLNLRRLLEERPIAGQPSPTANAHATRMAKTANVICAYAGTPDILAVQGVENQAALSELAVSVNARDGNLLFPGSCSGDPGYRAYLPPGRMDSGLQPGFLVSTASVRPGVPRVEVLSVTRGEPAQDSGPSNAPLVMEARINDAQGHGLRLTVIDAQFSALPRDASSPGSQHGLEKGRAAQSAWLAEVIAARQRRNPEGKLLVLGDFDAPGDGDASAATATLTNLTARLPLAERYTVVSDGERQAADLMFANAALLKSSPRAHVNVARVNADFGEDNLGDAGVPMRVSDHDPIVGYFELR